MNNNHPQGFGGANGAMDDGYDEEYSDNYDEDVFDENDMINKSNQKGPSQPQLQLQDENGLFMEEQASDAMILNQQDEGSDLQSPEQYSQN